MNFRNILLNVLFVTAAGIILAACADTDAQYEMAKVNDPVMVASNPKDSTVLETGEQTFTITYDKNIFFSSAKYNQIQFTGGDVLSAVVYGASPTLTVTVNVKDNETPSTFTIPEGLVTGPNGSVAKAVTINFNGLAIPELAQEPVVATSAKAKALYNYLKANYKSKIISGMMANVAWNNEESEKVYGYTGKYPAINGYDYGHLQASWAGANWINYADITPVKQWSDNGGIVQVGWHWNVPTKEVTSGNGDDGYAVTTLWEGTQDMPSDWSGNIQLTDNNTKAVMAKAYVGAVLTVSITNVAAGAQGSIKNSSWTGFVDEEANNWEYFDISGESYSMTLDQTTLDDMRANGFIISGHDYTVTKITVETNGAIANVLDPVNDFSYKPGLLFDIKNAVTEGTWEYQFVQDDLKKVATYLKLLKDADIPVLWRPLHEASGGWFWWGTDAEAFKTLWIMMFDYFKAEGLDNLIWVWTCNGDDFEWYPGDEYVDIVGRDLYGNDAASCADEYNKLYTHYGKIIALSECGFSEYTNSFVAAIDQQWNAGAKWAWFMPWYTTENHAPQEWWGEFMNSDLVITRDEVSF
jgi:mannan endo-1,4-beta-mannosidase